MEGQGSLTEEPREEKEEVSGEQRTQALRALLLARKRKHHTTENDGMCRSFLFCVLSHNYSLVVMCVKCHVTLLHIITCFCLVK